jgi:hypothetical protein
MIDAIKMKPRPGEMRQLKEEAWLGDAVLEVFMRSWVLEQRGRQDMVTKVNLTSNAFLSSLGNPMKMEAQIGRIYRDQCIEAAWTWIREHVLPVFQKHEAKRLRARAGRK